MVHGCELFVPHLRRARRGGIINVASAAGFAAAPAMAPYNVSKAAVVSLSETLAAELSGTGLAVTVLCPTFVRTNVARDGRITAGSARLATELMRWTGFSPDHVARITLDAHERGRLQVLPQLDARVVFGPNSGPGHNSALVYLEAQIDYLAAAIGMLLERNLHSLEVRRDRQDRYNHRLQRRLRATTWAGWPICRRPSAHAWTRSPTT